MNIDALKWRAIAKRHQLVHLGPEGRLLDSCESILPLLAWRGQEILSHFDLFSGMEETILSQRPGEPHLQLPMVEFSFQGNSYWLTMAFWAEADVPGVLWLLSAEDLPNERLRRIQQERNETHIGLERMQEQEQTLREYTARLEQAHENLQRFAYIVSHDLKAPLRAIAHISGWIQEGIEAGEFREMPEHLELLRSRVQRVEALIDGITRYHRAGRGRREREWVDLRALVQEAHEMAFTDRTAALILPSELPVLYCSRIALYQVLSNLLSNVHKYGHATDSRIEVRCELRGSHYLIGILDNGPGIDPRQHERIFEVFQTLRSKDEDDSTGMGLSIVQRIVEEQGGKVWVESALGEGAAFWFTWEVGKEAEAQQA